MDKTARYYNCALCHRHVRICARCDRGNIYCNLKCASLARQISIHEAQKRYQQTFQGKQKHAARQRRYRARQLNKSLLLKIVTHQGSHPQEHEPPLAAPEEVRSDSSRCHFCDSCISEFLRTDYLHAHSYRPGVAVCTFPQGP